MENTIKGAIYIFCVISPISDDNFTDNLELSLQVNW